jgi:NADH-quinone oxidoreductase subunit L
MVTAGVYLIARLGALYLDAPTAMAVTAWVGAATALLGATLAVTQFNLKKVLAYSTVSQIGLMILACGVGAFQAAMFHLVTHAFFKACLFLGAGAVLHALQGEEDMRKMGGLARRLPFTFATFLVATLALCGIPPFAGFFSKDEILWQAFSATHGSALLWLVALAASSLTAFYMFRAVYLTFFGTSRVTAEVANHVHEPPASMATVLAVLALGALGIGFIGLPAIWAHLLGVGSPLQTFLAPALASAATSAGHHAASTEWLLMAIAVLAAIGGIVVAWFLFGRGTARETSSVQESRGLWFDRVYEQGVVRGLDWISASVLARRIEAPLAQLMLRSADGARRASRLFVRLQTGNVQAYAFYALAGLAIVLWWGALHD